MKYTEHHNWYSECGRVWIRRTAAERVGKRVYEVSTRCRDGGPFFFSGRRATLPEAKSLAKAALAELGVT